MISIPIQLIPTGEAFRDWKPMLYIYTSEKRIRVDYKIDKMNVEILQNRF